MNLFKSTSKALKSKNNNNDMSFDDMHFIGRLPDIDVNGKVPEFCPVNQQNIQKVTLKDYLNKNININNITFEYINGLISQYFSKSNMKNRKRISLMIGFDKEYLSELKDDFEFIISDRMYNKKGASINVMKVIGFVQNKYRFIVPDRAGIMIGGKLVKKSDNILDVIIKKYVEIKKMPDIIIKWKPLAIDLIVKGNRIFNVPQDNDQKMWDIIVKKYKQDVMIQAKKKVSKVKKKHKEHLQHLSKTERAAINLYTTDELYVELNNVCRKKDPIAIKKWMPYSINVVRGLKKLPYYWGFVYRGWHFDITDEDFERIYSVNHCVLWDAFTSTSKRVAVADMFAGGQAIFRIKTWHGRWIEPLSAKVSEEEVLLNASTYFKVTKVTKDASIKGENYTYQVRYLVDLEEIVRPWSKQAVLWVDDWLNGNKIAMETLERQGIMVIPRTTTKEAIYFLEHELPSILNRDFTNFRIITDMSRQINGVWYNNKGADFIKQLRDKGYHHLVCVYVGNAKNAIDQCKKLNLNMGSILVTTSEDELMAFAQNILICPCSYYKNSSNNNNNNNCDAKDDNKDNAEATLNELKKIELSKIYGGSGVDYARCNVCYKKPKELIYHCPKGKWKAHKHGYDVCELCAINVLKGSLKLKLNDIPPKYLKHKN